MLPADGDADNTRKARAMLMTAVNVLIIAVLCIEVCVLLTRTDSDV